MDVNLIYSYSAGIHYVWPVPVLVGADPQAEAVHHHVHVEGPCSQACQGALRSL
jgi:hypothetical protein